MRGLLSKRFCSRKRPNGQTRGFNSFHNSFWGSRLSCLVRRKMLLHDSWWHLLCCQVIEEHHASGWPFHLPPSLHWTRWDCRDYLGKIRWSKNPVLKQAETLVVVGCASCFTSFPSIFGCPDWFVDPLNVSFPAGSMVLTHLISHIQWKKYRHPRYFMVKTMVSHNCSLTSIHW